MKQYLAVLTKYFKFIYSIYYYFGGITLKILGLFLKTDQKLLLFVSYGGKKFDDSPKAIYEKIIQNPEFDEYKIVWGFNKPGDFSIPRGKKVEIDTVKYFYYALKAKVWITNSSVERGLNFKKKNTLYINTWHGTPIKKMGNDIQKGNKSFNTLGNSNIDVMLAQSVYEIEIFSRMFNIPKENFLLCGLPRNDELTSTNKLILKEFKESLNIPLDKKIILYAPTFREYERNSKFEITSEPPVNLNEWRRELSDEYVLLIRAHYEVKSLQNMDFDNVFLFNVSDFPDINKLMMSSDILISDYSSIFVDFSLLNKPMFCYAYDYEKYQAERGLYFDVRDKIPGGFSTESELIEEIKHAYQHKNLEKIKLFKNEYVTVQGQSTQKVIDLIKKYD